ncbi:MAG: efflux RND transporter periplasmic adaptor subunit, partial [Planctomycetaceae bacterium]|nr:efflux RND transporter periplasmic adaptor subunit [Planctomycetaceae bacterium]
SYPKSVVISVALVVGALLIVGGWGLLGSWGGSAEDAASSELREGTETPTETNQIELTPAKLEQSPIHSSVVGQQSLRDSRVIPGHLEYQQAKHIALRAPTDGTLQKVLIQPGDPIQAGTPVAVFDSPEIGKARSEVLHREALLEVATRRRNWEEEIVTNTQALIEGLANSPDMSDLENTFKRRTLGQARETLMATYSDYQLAKQMLEGTESLSSSGTISSKTLLERTAKRRATEAAFHAATEQVLFDSQNRFAEAELEWKKAQRELEIAQQRVNTLLGYTEPPRSNDSKEPISRVELCSPIAGTVEKLHFASNERVSQSEPLIVIADTNTLWVSAEVRENDWAALQIGIGDDIQVQSPALPEKSMKARVVYVGREVSEQTHALPLVAEVPNPDGQLRPGLFVRVRVPIGQPKEVLAVPPSAIMQHEGKAFVFVDQGTGKFQRVDVKTGMETPEWTEIRSGLSGGERVVDRGAFVLKSELLLEGEDE